MLQQQNHFDLNFPQKKNISLESEFDRKQFPKNLKLPTK